MDHNNLERIAEIARKFRIEGGIEKIVPFGNGIINDSYKVCCGACDYLMQRINTSIFKDVDLLQSNILKVCNHIRAKLTAEGCSDIDRKVMQPIKLKDSDLTYCEDRGEHFRLTLFIRDSHTLEVVNEHSSYEAGKAFGQFEAYLTDLDEPLGETIPDFHNMELRSRQLREAVAADPASRVNEVQDLLDYIALYDEQMCMAERLHREGLLPKRICHCDTKVNNMLFDSNGEPLCVIDLDTVMPSFVFSDFGDFMRTAASTVAEDEPDISKVAFRMDIFKAFAKGYVESAGSFLSPVEKENLPYAALLFPYMQAVRFLCDYINGDVYYKISYPEHNLVRACNQIALFKSVLGHYSEMQDYIAAL
ncbi:MAG: phosphotransferase enzyme family protein [Candidatus Cryptobacteroides sp.]